MAKQRSLDAAKQQHPNKIGLKDCFGYAMGDAANLFVLTYVSSYLKVFYTDILKIEESKITVLLLIARLWDAINDPLWGNIVAKKKPNKAGKYRSYIKWFAIPLGVMAALCFFNFNNFTSDEALKSTITLVMMYVTYIGFGMMYTTINIPYGSLASVITDDPEGRTLLSTFRSVGAGLGGAIPLLIGPMIIYNGTGKFNKFGEEIKSADENGMLLFGAIMGALSIVFFFLCYGMTKERVKPEEEPKTDFKAAYKGMLTSRPFIAVAISGILVSGLLQFGSFNQYLYKNYFENPNLGIFGTIANYAPMAIMLIFTPKLSKKFGKKELCGIGTLLSSVTAIIMYFTMPMFERGAPKGEVSMGMIMYLVFTFIIGIGYSFVSITTWAIVTDVIDYQEYKTGIRNESAIYAVYTFCRNLGQTIADVGGMKILSSYVGYDGKVMANEGFIEKGTSIVLENGKIFTATVDVSDRLLLVCTLAPAIIYALIFVLYQFAYPLSKKKLEPVYKYIRESRAENE